MHSESQLPLHQTECALMSEWQPIESAPRNGLYLIANALGEVCAAESDEGHRFVFNNVRFANWTFGAPATHWMPLPAPPLPAPV